MGETPVEVGSSTTVVVSETRYGDGMNTEHEDEFVLSIVVRRRSDLEHPADPAEAVAMVRERLEHGAFLDVLNVVGRRRYTALPEPTDGDGWDRNPQPV